MNKFIGFSVLLCLLIVGLSTVSYSQKSTDEMLEKSDMLLAQVVRSLRARNKLKDVAPLYYENQKNFFLSAITIRLDKNYVNLHILEYPDEKKSMTAIKDDFVNAKLQEPSPAMKITGLGDEAYLRKSSGYTTSIAVRKQNLFIVVSGSTSELAKLYAKQTMAEIDKIQSKKLSK